MKLIKSLGAILLTVAALFGTVFAAAFVTAPLTDEANLVSALFRPAMVTIFTLALVYLLHRFRKRSWAALGLAWRRSAVPEALLGAAAGTVAMAAANGVSVALGVAALAPWDTGRLVHFPLMMAIVTLGQAFPEEVLFRGALFGTLPAWLSPRAVLVAATASFAVIHVVSQSPASGWGERLLYVAMAAALGLACGAARVRTGAVWMAAGLHAGFHFGMRLVPTREIDYGLQLVVYGVAMSAVAAVVLLAGRRAAPAGRT